jgi:hypothetical protein
MEVQAGLAHRNDPPIAQDLSQPSFRLRVPAASLVRMNPRSGHQAGLCGGHSDRCFRILP